AYRFTLLGFINGSKSAFAEDLEQPIPADHRFQQRVTRAAALRLVGRIRRRRRLDQTIARRVGGTEAIVARILDHVPPMTVLVLVSKRNDSLPLRMGGL